MSLAVQRICSNLAQVRLSLSAFHFSLDLFSDPVDRSDRASAPQPGAQLQTMSIALKLVQQECRFHFIGRHNRTVIFSVQAPTLDDAIQKFRSSGLSDSDALFIIKTETQIFLGLTPLFVADRLRGGPPTQPLASPSRSIRLQCSADFHVSLPSASLGGRGFSRDDKNPTSNWASAPEDSVI